MVDPTRLLRLLRSVTDEVSVLGREATAEPSRREDVLWLRGVKYAFVTAIEACVDAAQHICATSGWGPPSDNGDAMRLLGAHGILERDHAERMARAVGFRNLLVHEYARVDDGIVVARLEDLEDLHEFARRTAALAH
ncbi:MAG: DUF86 domain-containing protein [Kineosporiaceae bacterium]